MADYFVKNGGSDAADGLSDANAWETVEKARTTVTGSDTVSFKRGDVFIEPNSMWQIPGGATVGAYDTGNRPILEASPRITGWVVHSGSVYKVTSFTQTTAAEEMLWEDGVAMTRVGAVPTGSGEFYLDDAADTLYFWATDSADPDTHTVIFSGTGTMYRIDGDSGTLENIEIRYGTHTAALLTGEFGVLQSGWSLNNCVFQKGRHHGFQQFGNVGSDYQLTDCEFAEFYRFGCIFDKGIINSTISGCSFHDCQGTNNSTGLQVNTEQANPNVLITNCTAYNNQSDGMGAAIGALGMTFEFCTAYNNGIGEDDRAGFTNFGLDTIFRYCISYSNGTDTNEQQGTGFQNDVGHQTAQLYYCIAYGNQSAGFACTQGSDGAGNGSTFHNCVAYDNGQGASAIHATGFQLYGSNINDLEVKNCIFSMNYIDAAKSRQVNDNNAVVGSSSGVVFDYNCYFDNDQGTNLIKWNGSSYASLSAFNSATGQEANGIESDPLFADASSQNFRLLPASPCRDAGEDLGYTRDYEGNPVPQ